MELRQLRYFVAVAEELHFSRAASRLGVAQPALSHHIRQLERELDGELFARTTRAVSLTGAGRVLADEARALLEHVERIEAAARTSADDRSGALRIGAFPSANMTVLPRLLRSFRERQARVAIDLRELTTREQIAQLRAGELDAGLVYGPLREDDIAWQRLLDEPLVAAVPAEHALARRERLALEALTGEPFILFARERSPALHDALIEHCRARGFTPRVEHEVGGMMAAAAMVAAGLGVSLLPASLAERPQPGAAFLPLSDPAPTVSLLLIWHCDRATPMLSALSDASRTVRGA